MPEQEGYARRRLEWRDEPLPPIPRAPFVELGLTTPFSFLRGASDAVELIPQAMNLGMDAIGVADRNTLAGRVRIHSNAKTAGVNPLIGCRLVVPLSSMRPCPRAEPWSPLRANDGGTRKARDRTSRLSPGPRRLCPPVAPAQPRPGPRDQGGVPPHPRRRRRPCRGHRLHRLAGRRPRSLRSAAAARPRRATRPSPHRRHPPLPRRRPRPDRAARPLRQVLRRHHARLERRPLSHARQAPVAGRADLHPREDHAHRRPASASTPMPNGTSRAPRKWPACSNAGPTRSRATRDFADALGFSLDELKYEYPRESVPDNLSPQAHLEVLTWAGAQRTLSQRRPRQGRGPAPPRTSS